MSWFDLMLAAIAVWWAFALIRTTVNLLALPHARASDLGSERPLVSVIIPARDEALSICATVTAFGRQTYEPLEVIVVNDRSSDATGAIVAALARENDRIRLIDGVEPPEGWLGKPWALHQGSRVARGEVLLFVDADVIYRHDAVAACVAFLVRSRAAMASFLPHLEAKTFWELVAIPQLPLLALTVLPLWLTNRLRLPLLGVGGGPGNILWRRDYEAVGGHTALRDAVVDDIALARLVRRRGLRTGVARAGDLISVRMYRGLREVIDGFTKNAFASVERSYALAAAGVVSSLLTGPVPYVAALFGNRYAIAAVSLITMTRVVLFRAVRYPLWAAVLLHPLQTIVWAFIIIRSAWRTGVRRRLEWRGRAYDAKKTRFGA